MAFRKSGLIMGISGANLLKMVILEFFRIGVFAMIMGFLRSDNRSKMGVFELGIGVGV